MYCVFSCKFNAFFQCPTPWTSLHIIASSGKGEKSFFPAAVQVKNAATHGEVSKHFYYLNWEDNIVREVRGKLEKHQYEVAITHEFRKCFEQCVLLAFDQFHLETIVLGNDETVTNPTCNQPAEFLVTDIIPDIDRIFARRISLLEKERELKLSRQLQDLVNIISTGHIAEVCVQMTQSYRVNKNWNSHGAKVGAAICDAACLIAMIEKCNYPVIESDAKCKLDGNFRQTIPRGRVLTGQMHRSEDNVYIEYMIAPYSRGKQSPMTFTNLFSAHESLRQVP